MNTYTKYKPSGVEWIGEIPQNWDISRVKAAFYRKKEKAYQENPTILSLTSRGIVERDISHNEGQIAESYFEYNPVDVGDLLLNPMDLVTNAFASVSKLKGVISPAYFNLVHKDKINSKYFEYYFKLQYWNKSFFAHGKGVSIEHRWTLNQETLMNFPIPLPNDEEQTAIANFLDEKTAKIDALIEKKKQLIELLKEERTAIINQAVTKGIDPNVKLKPSGIDWLGDIPEHWLSCRINRKIKVKDGTHDTPFYVANTESNFPLITSKDFENEEIVFEDAKYISPEDHYNIFQRSNTEKGDIIMSMIGGNIGNLVLVKTDRKFSIKNVALFKTSHNKTDAMFLYYILKSSLLKIQIDLNSRGGAQGFLSLGDLRSLVYFVVPEEEKKAIVNYIQTQTNRIDNSISKIEKEILLLMEYRTSLISEVVTGKIKVV